MNVFKTAWKRELYIHAFTHDLSKFRPKEFFPYAKYFYKDKERYQKQFKKAWFNHYKNNKHHWQFWIDKDGNPVFIPTKYLKQIVVDWEGMALKFGDTAKSYYLNNYQDMKLEPDTRVRLEKILGINQNGEVR